MIDLHLNRTSKRERREQSVGIAILNCMDKFGIKMAFCCLLAALIMVWSAPVCDACAEADEGYYPEGWDISEVGLDVKVYQDFQYVYDEYSGGISIKAYIGDDPDVVVPDIIDGYPVIDLDQYMYRKIYIKTVTYGPEFGIVNGEFVADNFVVPFETEAVYVSEDHPYLKSVDGILYNKDMTVLYFCPPSTYVTEYYVPDTVTEVYPWALYEINTIRKVVFSEKGHIECARNIFAYSDSIETAELKGIRVICGESFLMCPNLKTVVFGDGLEQIGWASDEDDDDESNFCYCESLENVTFPDTLSVIGTLSFSDCPSLERIKLPDRISYLGRMAFNKCGDVDRISIPKCCTFIGSGVFANCLNSDIIYPQFMYRKTDDYDDSFSYFAGIKLGKKTVKVSNVYKLKVRGSTKILKKGEFAQLRLKAWYLAEPYSSKGNLTKHKKNVAYSNLEKGLFCFESSNPDIVSVDECGRITAKDIGTAVVTVSVFPTPEIACTCTVTVK